MAPSSCDVGPNVLPLLMHQQSAHLLNFFQALAVLCALAAEASYSFLKVWSWQHHRLPQQLLMSRLERLLACMGCVGEGRRGGRGGGYMCVAESRHSGGQTFSLQTMLKCVA